MAPSTYDIGAIIKTILPDAFWQQLEGQYGWEVFTAIDAVFERMQGDIQETFTNMLIGNADFGGFAESVVVILRSGGTTTPLTMPAGIVVKTDSGLLYESTEDLGLWANGATKNPTVRAKTRGYQFNVAADAINEVVTVPIRGGDDATYTVQSSTAATGGKFPMLSLIGKGDYGIYPQSGETAAAYRERLKAFPEVVTKTAIIDRVTRVLQEFTNTAPVMQEHWETAFFMDCGSVGDADDQTDGFLDQTSDTFIQSAEMSRGAFYLDLPEIPAITDDGMFLDCGYLDNEYLDIYDSELEGLLLGIMQLVDQIKAAGIAWRYRESL